MNGNIKSVCVFCGSSPGDDVAYGEAAQSLGVELAHHGVSLVYGGSTRGLMGLIADSHLEHHGYTIGIIPKALAPHEVQHRGLNEIHVVNSMHERKALMADLADAFVALPGGIGTYEELFEVIAWAQLGIHRKPILVLNTKGYFDPFFQMVRHGVEQGFIRSIDPGLIRTTDSVKEVLPLLQAEYTSEFHPKWMLPDYPK